jgi:glucose-1-phosphate cytidylyltransferase
MKVVLFCGGRGMRLRDAVGATPKPLVPLGGRPILWHVMKYYAHYGHRDFILCLGYGAEAVRRYFRSFGYPGGDNGARPGTGRRCRDRSGREGDAWRLTFVDTGLDTPVGERLRRVRPLVESEDVFLANYCDGLSDLPLPEYVARATRTGAVASFVCVRPSQTFHVVDVDTDGFVRRIAPVEHSGLRVNGGFFVFRREIFGALTRGDDLVPDVVRRLAAMRRLYAWRYDGFWMVMDTFKDWKQLQQMCVQGFAPWMVWEADRRPAAAVAL